MPHNQEGSDLKSSAHLIQEMQENSFFQSLNYFDNLDSKIKEALLNLIPTGYVTFFKEKELNKEKMYEKLYCVDGSLINLSKEGGELIALRIGAAVLETQDLFSIQRDSFGNTNPFQVAQLFQNENNLFLNAILPSSNIYHTNGQIYDMKTSFKYAIDNIFEGNDNTLGTQLKQYFLNHFNASNPYINTFSDLPFITKIIKSIRDENIIFNTQNETKKIMLSLESILAQYLLEQSTKYNEKGLIVLDGRLQNEDIGNDLNILSKNNITSEKNMLIGVQKTGLLNTLLSKIHLFLKNYTSDDFNDPLLPYIKEYKNNSSILIIPDNNFKNICGIPISKHGIYGRECLYISKGPDRKEFVFTLPNVVFEKNMDILEKILFSVCSVLEYANTDLYIANKGVLLANILAHANVSLNKKHTQVLGDVNPTPPNINSIKKKL